MRTPRRPGEELHIYLRFLAEDALPGQFLELRWSTADGRMRRHFFPAQATHSLAWRISQLAPRGDVYIGVALRDDNTFGGRDAISGSRLLFIESDRHDGAQRVASFPHPPSVETASGTPGHLHLYWRLTEHASNEQAERVNRRLALELGGDPASVDIARILRPPGTLNHKHRPPQGVKLITHRPSARYALAELVSCLPDDPRPARLRPTYAASLRTGRTLLDRELLAIPAEEYVRVLVGATPNRSGKIACPFHDDRNPSLHLYADGTFACFGSSCEKAGSIFDFAAAAWGIGTKGSDFLQLRRRLAETFGFPLGGLDRGA